MPHFARQTFEIWFRRSSVTRHTSITSILLAFDLVFASHRSSLAAMDADPWADAPPSPRPADPASPVSPGRPAATAPSGSATSPLAESSTARVAETSSPSPQAAPPLTAAESPRPSALGDSAEADDGFDEFDDFDEPAAGPSSGGGAGFVSATTAGEDDGFGDFGDFEEGDFEEAQEEPAAGAMLGGQIAHEPQPVDERWVSGKGYGHDAAPADASSNHYGSGLSHLGGSCCPS